MLQGLMAHCEKHMAYFITPRYVRIMEHSPKTPTERVQKEEGGELCNDLKVRQLSLQVAPAKSD